MRYSGIFCVAIVLTLLCSPLSAATITLHAEPVTLPYSDVEQTGSFEVYFESVGTPEEQLGGYQLVLNLAGDGASSISLTGASATTEHPPVFTPTGLLYVVPTSDGLQASDFVSSGTVPIDDGDGLLKIDFKVAGGTTGTFDVLFDMDPGTGTLLSDASGTAIPFSAVDGGITVLPEPTSCALLGVTGLFLIRRRTNANR